MALIDEAKRVHRRKRKLATKLLDFFQALHSVIHDRANPNAHVRRALGRQLFQNPPPVGRVERDLERFAAKRRKLNPTRNGCVGVLSTDDPEHARHLQGCQRFQDLGFGSCFNLDTNVNRSRTRAKTDALAGMCIFHSCQVGPLHLRVVADRFLAHCREQVSTSDRFHHLAGVNVSSWVSGCGCGGPASLVEPVQQTSSPRTASAAFIFWVVVHWDLFCRVDAGCVGKGAPPTLQAVRVSRLETNDESLNAPSFSCLGHEYPPPRIALVSTFQRRTSGSDWQPFHLYHLHQ